MYTVSWILSDSKLTHIIENIKEEVVLGYPQSDVNSLQRSSMEG